MPLLALTYSMGGISATSLWLAIWMLFLTTLTVGAVSLACSAYARTTAGAFIGTYPGLVVLAMMLGCFCAPVFMVPAGRNEEIVGMGIVSFLLLCITTGLLMAARTFLIDRAFLPPRNLLLEMFQALDQMFHDMNTMT